MGGWACHPFLQNGVLYQSQQEPVLGSKGLAAAGCGLISPRLLDLFMSMGSCSNSQGAQSQPTTSLMHDTKPEEVVGHRDRADNMASPSMPGHRSHHPRTNLQSHSPEPCARSLINPELPVAATGTKNSVVALRHLAPDAPPPPHPQAFKVQSQVGLPRPHSCVYFSHP